MPEIQSMVSSSSLMWSKAMRERLIDGVDLNDVTPPPTPPPNTPRDACSPRPPLLPSNFVRSHHWHSPAMRSIRKAFASFLSVHIGVPQHRYRMAS